MLDDTLLCSSEIPQGTESLPRDIINSVSDLFPRRLWGRPEEVCFERQSLHLLPFSATVCESPWQVWVVLSCNRWMNFVKLSLFAYWMVFCWWNDERCKCGGFKAWKPLGWLLSMEPLQTIYARCLWEIICLSSMIMQYPCNLFCWKFGTRPLTEHLCLQYNMLNLLESQ